MRKISIVFFCRMWDSQRPSDVFLYFSLVSFITHRVFCTNTLNLVATHILHVQARPFPLSHCRTDGITGDERLQLIKRGINSAKRMDQKEYILSIKENEMMESESFAF